MDQTVGVIVVHGWAATWQNQQCGCAPSEDSDQPGHPPSLIRVFTVRMKKAWVLSYPLSAQRRLIRLGGCPSWSESSLGAHSFCCFCHVVAHLIFNKVGKVEGHRFFSILYQVRNNNSVFLYWKINRVIVHILGLVMRKQDLCDLGQLTLKPASSCSKAHQRLNFRLTKAIICKSDCALIIRLGRCTGWSSSPLLFT